MYRYLAGILEDSIRNAMILLITPILFLLVSDVFFGKGDVMFKRRVFKALLILFFIESGLAIIEFAFKGHIFPWIDTTFESNLYSAHLKSGFRSVALHGSPLTNALIITVLNTFLINSELKDKYKLSLWLFGFAAILAFNARAATILNVSVLFIYLIKLTFNTRTHGAIKIAVYFGATMAIGLVTYLVVFYNLGDRLFNDKLFDEASGQKRLDVFAIFEYHDLGYFFFGHPMKDFTIIQESVGLLIIENFWVCEIILFGIVFVVALVFLYVKLLIPYFRGFPWVTGGLVCGSFIALASTNNSLYTQYIPLFVFLLCMSLFRPNTFKYLVPPRYIKQ